MQLAAIMLAHAGVFVAGDMHRGASLIVWAIAEGRAAAAAIHRTSVRDTSAPVTPFATLEQISA